MSWLIPERFTDDRCRRHGWWVLLALTALLYLPGLGTLPLMDRDEPRFAHATVEMMQRGAWVIPYFNSDPAVSDATRIQQMRQGKGAMEVGYRFDKPPLTYWWMRLHYQLFGINEFAARLHSVIATWLVALVTFGMAGRIAGARAGLAAGLAWITTLQVIVHGRLCVADMPMVLFVALACWAILECLVGSQECLVRSAQCSVPDPESPAPEARPHELSTEHSALRTSPFFWPLILHVSLGLGFLAKGPVALLVPGLALLLMRFAFWRKPLPWRRLKLWPGLLITLAIIAAWGIPALVETQGLYWKVGMQEHVVERGAKAFNGRFPVPGYYLVTALLSLFPWIALLPMVWTRVREKWDAKMAFLVSWLAAPYIIFTLYATQLPHYVMPGFPAAMVLLMVCGDLPTARRWHAVFAAVVLGLMFSASAAGGIFLARLKHQYWTDDGLPSTAEYPLWFLVALLSGACGALNVYVAACCLPLLNWMSKAKNRLPRLAKILILLAAGAGSCIYLVLLTLGARQLHPAAQLAAKAGPLPDKVELFGWQFNEPSLTFYFHHPWKFPSKLDSISERMSRKGARVVVVQRREWTLNHSLKDKLAGKDGLSTDSDFSKEVDALIAAHPDYKVSSFDGMNPARGSWAELRMLVRK